MTRLRERTLRGLYIVTLLLSVIAFVLIAAAVILLHEEEPEITETASAVKTTKETHGKPVSVPQDIPSPTQPRYTVILAGDELRLCTGDTAGAYTVLRWIDPRALRQADRDTLLTGLSLNSEEELARFLEDFGS